MQQQPVLREVEHKALQTGISQELLLVFPALKQPRVLLLAPLIRVDPAHDAGFEPVGRAGFHELEAILELQVAIGARPDVPHLAPFNGDPHLLQVGPVPHDRGDAGGRQHSV